MDKAVLLTKLIQSQDNPSDLYEYYLDATSRVFESETDAFNKCVKDLKVLSDMQYDFEWLKYEAFSFGVSRRDYKDLMDSVCVLLGERINELCKLTRNGIVTSPTQFEDYCPFNHEDLVLYAIYNINSVEYDGNMYSVVDTKLEETPYYTIYCNKLELM